MLGPTTPVVEAVKLFACDPETLPVPLSVTANVSDALPLALVAFAATETVAVVVAFKVKLIDASTEGSPSVTVVEVPVVSLEVSV